VAIIFSHQHYVLYGTIPALFLCTVYKKLLTKYWATTDKNLPTVLTFLQQLQEQFKDFIKYLNRNQLWQSFFVLCSSEKFVKLWGKLLSEAKVNPYQQLTTLMFDEEIRKAEGSSLQANKPLTRDEGNALCYTAGYHLCKQRNHDMKEELVLCLMELKAGKDSTLMKNRHSS